MARGKGAARSGKRDAVTVACTAWIIYRLIISSESNRSSIEQSLAEQEESDTKALLLLLCQASASASWHLEKALAKCATSSSKDAKRRRIFTVVLQCAIDTLGADLPYTVCEIPGKGLGVVAKERFEISAESLSETLYGTLEVVTKKQDAFWNRLVEGGYPSLYDAGGVRGLLIGPLSLLNEPSPDEVAHFVISGIPRKPHGVTDEISLSPSDRPAITASICATHVLAAAQAYADTGKVARGFKESVLDGSSAQIKHAAQQALVAFRRGAELTLNYGSGFVNTRKTFS